MEATQYPWTVLPQGLQDSPHLLGNAKELSLHKGTLQEYTDGLFISSAVTGKNKIWLLLSLFLSLWLCFCSLRGYCLYIMVCLREHSLPVKPKCLCLEKHPDPGHLGIAARKKILPHPLPELGYSGDIWEDLSPFLYFSFNSSAPPHLCSIKETGIQALIRYIFLRLVCHLLGLPAFWIKSFFLVPIYGLSHCRQKEPGLRNRFGEPVRSPGIPA